MTNNHQHNPQMTTSTGIDYLSHVITDLLTTTLQVTAFPSRWHSIRTHLVSLSSSILPSIASSPHHSSNPLLTQTLLPNLTLTLTRVHSLSLLCSSPDPSLPPPPKLLMQSDLDMASGWLSRQIHDLDLLLRSGVLNHSTAIVLSPPTSDSPRDDVSCFVRDLFARLQIGGPNFKLKSLDSLLLLLRDHPKSAALVSEEGNVGYLIGLLDSNGSITDLAVTAVSALACGCDSSRRRVFDEGGLGPLLRVVDSGSVAARERAAIAVEAIVRDADSVWALSAYGGIPTLVDACRAGSPALQAHAVGALRNAAAAREDVRAALVEEGAAPVLLHVLASGSPAAQEKAADCIAVMSASDEVFRSLVKRENGLVRLMDVLRDGPGEDVAEHVLRAVYALSSSDRECRRVLSASAAFVGYIVENVAHGNAPLQHVCCLILSLMTLSDGNKRAAAGCMPALLKLMELSKPDGIAVSAAGVLVCLLTARGNRKDLVKDEKCVVRLVNMLDPRQDRVAKELAVTVMASVLAGGNERCRRRMAEAGALQFLQKLAEMGVAGAKKVVQRLSGNRLKSLFSMTWREFPGK